MLLFLLLLRRVERWMLFSIFLLVLGVRGYGKRVVLSVHPDDHPYWGSFQGWNEYAQCEHLCEFQQDHTSKDVQYLIRPGFLSPGDPALKSETWRNVIVLYEGWHDKWLNLPREQRDESNVELIIGYTPKADYWLPIDCVGILQLVSMNKSKIVEEILSDDDRTLSVAAFVSNCNHRNHRTHVLGELIKHVKVDSYGKCHNTEAKVGNDRHIGPYQSEADLKTSKSEDSPHSRKIRVASHYPFLIAMQNHENQVQDYVNEKVYDAFRAGAVPIYLGSRSNFGQYFHPDTVVDVSDFRYERDGILAYNITALATHLRRVHQGYNGTLFKAMRIRGIEQFSHQSTLTAVQRCLALRSIETVFDPHLPPFFQHYFSNVFCAACTALVSRRGETPGACTHQTVNPLLHVHLRHDHDHYYRISVEQVAGIVAMLPGSGASCQICVNSNSCFSALPILSSHSPALLHIPSLQQPINATIQC